MTYKQIEASRELRLWIGQVIVPAIGVSAAILANPNVRKAASEKLEDVKKENPDKEDQGRITAALFFLYFQDAGDQKRC